MEEEFEINVDVIGEGKPTLLIHGFLEKGSMWQFLLESLSDRQLIIPDLPGHGGSGLPDHPLQLADYADVCLDILDELNADKVDIIGHSMGGYIACAMYESAPEKVGSLMLYHSCASNDSEEKKQMRDRAINMVRSHKEHYNRSMINSLFAAGDDDKHAVLIDRLVAEANRMTSESIITALAAMKDRSDSVGLLKKQDIPVAYLLGDQDERLPMAEMNRECEAVLPTKVMVLQGVGHMSQFEAPEQAALKIKNWLSTIVQ